MIREMEGDVTEEESDRSMRHLRMTSTSCDPIPMVRSAHWPMLVTGTMTDAHPPRTGADAPADRLRPAVSR